MGQLFGSPDVAPAEKKTLVFTDSVQDASHRAAFVESRAYALNLRALMHRAIGDDGCTLDALGDADRRQPRDDPPTGTRCCRPTCASTRSSGTYWTDDDARAAVARAVAKRMAFAATLEFGLSSRTGRTLELTGAVTAHVEVDDLAASRLEAARRRPSHARTCSSRSTAIGAAADARRGPAGPRTHPHPGRDRPPWLAQYRRRRQPLQHLGRAPAPRGHAGLPARPAGARRSPPSARGTPSASTASSARASWYATWTARALRRPARSTRPRYVRALLDALVADGALTAD